MTKSSGRTLYTARKPSDRARAKSIKYFCILNSSGLLCESREQGGPMLFSSVAQAQAELRFHPVNFALIVPVTLTITD